MRKLLSISFFIFSIFCNASTMEWISIDGSGSANVVSKEVLQSDASSYRVKVLIHGLCDQLVDNESGNFHKLSLDINSRLTSIGDPALPVFSQFLAIPEGTIMDVKIQEKKWSDFHTSSTVMFLRTQ